MRYLLDTHVLLWSLYAPSRVSDEASDVIASKDNIATAVEEGMALVTNDEKIRRYDIQTVW